MTRDDIVQIAWDVGLFMRSHKFQDEPTKLERFAERIAAEKEQQIIYILERLQERAGDAHNYYKYAINVIQQEQPR